MNHTKVGVVAAVETFGHQLQGALGCLGAVVQVRLRDRSEQRGKFIAALSAAFVIGGQEAEPELQLRFKCLHRDQARVARRRGSGCGTHLERRSSRPD